MRQPVLNVTEDKAEEMVETSASKRESLTWNNQSEPVEGATDWRNLTIETPEPKYCLSFFFLLGYFGHVTNNSFGISQLRAIPYTYRYVYEAIRAD